MALAVAYAGLPEKHPLILVASHLYGHLLDGMEGLEMVTKSCFQRLLKR